MVSNILFDSINVKTISLVYIFSQNFMHEKSVHQIKFPSLSRTNSESDRGVPSQLPYFTMSRSLHRTIKSYDDEDSLDHESHQWNYTSGPHQKMKNTSGSHTIAAPPLPKQNPGGFQRKNERESETEREAMDDAKISELKQFVNSVKSDPSILHNPSLSFFKSYLQRYTSQIFLFPFHFFFFFFDFIVCLFCSLGARIPEKPVR